VNWYSQGDVVFHCTECRDVYVLVCAAALESEIDCACDV